MHAASVMIVLSLSPSCLAQETAPPATAQPADILSSKSGLRLGPGDLVMVQVFQTPDLSGSIRIDDDGVALLPLGGRVRLMGLTPTEASHAIEAQLESSHVMLSPHVTLIITQYATQGITVLGEVNRAGTFTLLGPHSLYDALSAAGGVTPNEGSQITITHQEEPTHPVHIAITSPNYSENQRLTMLLPGDVVVVSRADLIYVVGDVARPGPYPVVSGVSLSVLNVLGLSQGMNRTALSKHASIVRQSSGSVITIPLNLDKIMRSEAPNLMLEASDVLVVPRSGRKVFLEFALPGATNAVTSAVTSALIIR